MKAIIDGRKYDTETAEVIDSYGNGRYGNDFYRLEETLYRKKTGEFFLCGDGGAMTEYGRPCGTNTWCGGKRIVPMTEAEAKLWLEQHGDTETYEAVFGEVEE